MAEYKIMDAHIDMSFNSFDQLPVGKPLAGEKFGLIGFKVIITSMNSHTISVIDGKDVIYAYRAAVMK